ncbi:5152_t:CDS:2 [Ambispora gerdemannii]|uniref:5152_t:CDS:1 n=1 Tax=Ambispora gerdemannii TaxID=144530 RepID=A0A9N9DQB7_9GLOM|nr:5152_t:CDS:2 [Ambispora gerdemannii]
MTNDLKNKLGATTEQLETVIAPHYTNLEPWQRGLLIIALILFLLFSIYHLTKPDKPLNIKRIIMYNTEQYFDFDSPKKAETKISKKKKQQALLSFLLLAGAAYYYFMIYLPEEETKQLEVKLQAEIDRVKNAKPDDVAEMLTDLQTYQQ